MAPRSRHHGHDKYKSRITHLFKLYADNTNTETQAEDAKYLAVLVSGYLEQAIKEILLEYASSLSATSVAKYIKDSWPTSKNMNTSNIESILKQFNEDWAKEFSDWLATCNEPYSNGEGTVSRRRPKKIDRKGDINSIVKWRNHIAHGQEAKTTNVTLVSVKDKFSTVRDLVSLVEGMVQS